MADRARFTVGYKLVWVEGDIEVKVVVYHNLHGLCCKALTLVLIYGFSVNVSCRTIAVSINSAVGKKLIQKLRSQLFVKFFRYIAEGVF